MYLFNVKAAVIYIVKTAFICHLHVVKDLVDDIAEIIHVLLHEKADDVIGIFKAISAYELLDLLITFQAGDTDIVLNIKNILRQSGESFIYNSLRQIFAQLSQEFFYLTVIIHIQNLFS